MDRGRSQWNNRFAGIRTPGNFFGGTDPFDDPFFTQPFGSLMGPSLFDRSLFAPTGNPFCESPFSFFMEDQQPPPKRSRGPIIEELPSDDEEQINIPRKCNNPSKESYIEKPEKGTEYSIASSSKPQTHSYSFHSSTVTYGGPGGAYYTSSTTRRTGGDGVTVEESKKADTTTRRATHRISRGLGDKGHSVTRKLNPDGRVDTVQTLHNINEDELPDFEEAWKDDARRHLPGWESGLNVLHDGSREGRHSASRGRALPAVMPQASSRPGPSSMGRP